MNGMWGVFYLGGRAEVVGREGPSFDVTYKPQSPMVGKNGVNLYNKWKDVPKSYLSLGVPDMPDYIMFVGPTWYIPPARVVTLSNLTNSLVGLWEMAVRQAPSYQSRGMQSRLLRSEKIYKGLGPKRSYSKQFQWARPRVD